jgi:hypothetical protein
MKGIYPSVAKPIEWNQELQKLAANAISRVTQMMRLETTDGRDWQGFTTILDIMTFLDEIDASSPVEIREAVEKFCQLSPNPGQSMSLEEVVFWAGVATGMEFSRRAEENTVDPHTAQKILIFSSIFAHSMKNAIVDLALRQLEPGPHKPWQELSRLDP